MDGWLAGWLDGWLAGWMDGWMDGWMARWMDGWMDGVWINITIHPCNFFSTFAKNYLFSLFFTLFKQYFHFFRTSGRTTRLKWRYWEKVKLIPVDIRWIILINISIFIAHKHCHNNINLQVSPPLTPFWNFSSPPMISRLRQTIRQMYFLLRPPSL